MRDGANLPRHARVASFAVFLHRSDSLYDDSCEVGRVIFVRAGMHAELFSEQEPISPTPSVHQRQNQLVNVAAIAHLLLVEGAASGALGL